MSSVFELLEMQQLPNVAALYQYFLEQPHLLEVGSSSFSSQYAETCTEIRTLMKVYGGISQRGESLNGVWAALGDESGILYFGRRKFDSSTEGQRSITPKEYLETLILLWPLLSTKAQVEFELMCGSLVTMFQAANDPARRQRVYSFDI